MAEDSPLAPGCDVLLLEDDGALRRRLAAFLRGLGAEVTEAGSLAEARRLAQQLKFEYAALDLHLPDGNVLAFLRDGLLSENCGIVVMTAFGGIKEAVEAMRLGAGDYITKPFETDQLPLAFARCRQQRRAARRDEHQAAAADAVASDDLFFGASLGPVRAQLDALLAAEKRLGRRLPPVLIEGETGTGKSALARWLHRAGPRAGRAFVTVNCAALPENLAEAELFGHERGAFTDAKAARVGLFEAADGGTLFLDEIAALSLATQARVLLAVEEGRIRRLGATKESTVDVRVIAASNRPLEGLVSSGAFREDLLHRLKLLHLALPPLRERGSDVVSLARHVLRGIAARHRRPGLHLTAEADARLLAQAWRGNIRELTHELERAAIFAESDALDLAHLGAAVPATALAPWRNPAWRLPESGFSLEETIDALVADALRETAGNVSAAARRLGVTREFLRYRLKGGAPENPPDAHSG